MKRGEEMGTKSASKKGEKRLRIAVVGSPSPTFRFGVLDCRFLRTQRADPSGTPGILYLPPTDEIPGVPLQTSDI
jgi:hypothetical protein